MLIVSCCCLCRALDVGAYRSHLWSMNKARRTANFLPSSGPKGSSGSNLMQLAMSDQSFTSPVVAISDVSQLLPISHDLAQMYRYDVQTYMYMYYVY